MRQAIICTNTDLIHWRIYAAPGRDELSVIDSITDNLLLSVQLYVAYISSVR